MNRKSENLWFLYETLNDENKNRILDEIDTKAYSFLKENSHSCTIQELDNMIYDEVVKGYHLNLLLGQSVETFGLREYIVRSRVEQLLNSRKGANNVHL